MVAITPLDMPTAHPTRPALRLVPPPARRPRYGLRRALALVVVTLALAVAALVADAAFGALSATPDSAPVVGASSDPTPAVVVVQPGDTLWSIAAEIAPDRDPRATVDRLVALNGSAAIQSGQRLVLPTD